MKKEGERKSDEKKIKPDTPDATKIKANGVIDRVSETDESRSKIRKKKRILYLISGYLMNLKYLEYFSWDCLLAFIQYRTMVNALFD